MPCLYTTAQHCLQAADPDSKVALTHEAGKAYAAGTLKRSASAPPPQPIGAPGRPDRPRLVEPRHLPQRSLGSREGRAAFIHAIAHIEFNAIDLAWDAVNRFRDMPEAYYADWVGVAVDEARHFRMLRSRLRDFGADYGDFDAHNGLWEMAEKTADDCLVRMALVPRVLEARGLDVTPAMIRRLCDLGDTDTVGILETILAEEIAHVAAGTRWFEYCCRRRGLDPEATFEALLGAATRGALRGPYNREARIRAGFTPENMAAIERRAAEN
ncbi:MAG TPA: ferritin-like domain-containing protein [Xanthomonadaceae bacterium]|nr:ferritin-like domain-containing protein [Xanthomonadaceae bacterium]